MSAYQKQADASSDGGGGDSRNHEHTAQVGGLSAIMQPRFGLRMAEWFCAMISFSVMGSATDVNETDATLASFQESAPSDDGCLAAECPSIDEWSGTFNLSPFRFLIATGVFIWIYTGCVMVLSLHKKTEGTRFCFVLPGWVLTKYTKNKGFIEFVFDTSLIIFAIFAIMASAVDIEVESKFTRDWVDATGVNATAVSEVTWFTISTFYSTFTDRGYNLKANPTSRVRGATAFMFFDFFLLTYSAVSSWKQWKHVETGTLSEGTSHVSEGSDDAVLVSKDARNSAI